MKRCPQCNSVFDDTLVYCTNDGTPLLEEIFVMPSENSQADGEEITIIHHDPITIDIPAAQNPFPPPEQFNYQVPPPTNIVPVVVEKPRSVWRNVLFLITGLILGGGVVLAAVLFGLYLYQNRTPPTDRNSSVNSAPNSKTSPNTAPLTASAKHEKHTAEADEDFNGRVIKTNAFVRSSPNLNSKQTDILPIDDRLHIEKQEKKNSPWFRVTCEHGTSGWMHGNTIEYTD